MPNGEVYDVVGKPSDWAENNEDEAGFVKNRTHYTTTTSVDTEFDYDISYQGYDEYPFAGGYSQHISPATPEPADFLGKTLVQFNRGTSTNIVVNEATVRNWEQTDTGYMWSGTYFIVLREDATGRVLFGTDDDTVFPAGIWCKPNSMPHISHYSFTTRTETVKKLDQKYLPDTVAMLNDIPTDEHINDLIAAQTNAITNDEIDAICV